jgi:hypothetical protein
MCALFSKDTLQLTWWPLARDCTYYCASLLVLALFFGVIADHPDAVMLQNASAEWRGQPGGPNDGVHFHGDPDVSVATVQWWEAVILLAMYVGYVLVMKFNQTLRRLASGGAGYREASARDDGAMSLQPMDSGGGPAAAAAAAAGHHLDESRRYVPAAAAARLARLPACFQRFVTRARACWHEDEMVVGGPWRVHAALSRRMAAP